MLQSNLKFDYLNNEKNIPHPEELQDIHITQNTEVASVLDGPMVITKCKNLTVDAGCTYSLSNRCAGWMIIANGTVTVNGIISMSGKGMTVEAIVRKVEGYYGADSKIDGIGVGGHHFGTLKEFTIGAYGAASDGGVIIIYCKTLNIGAAGFISSNGIAGPEVSPKNGGRVNVYYSTLFDNDGTIETNGSSYTENGHFYTPRNVAIDSSGNIYVVDTGNSRVQKFNSSGVYQLKFGSSGSGDGQFSSPSGIAIDSSGNIYVVDTGNNRVQKFDSSGNYLSKFGTYGTGNGQLSSPRGITLDSAGNIYVVDTGNSRVQKFNSSGVYQSKFGSSGSTDGKFSSPRGIAIDSAGNIYVVDTGNSRVQKFNSSGVYQSKFGSAGSTDGKFSSPSDIVFDSAGNIFIADTGNNRVQKFNSSHAYQSQFGTPGTGNGQFASLYGIKRDSSNNLFVVDANNSRVQKFDSSGTYQSQFGSGAGLAGIIKVGDISYKIEERQKALSAGEYIYTILDLGSAAALLGTRDTGKVFYKANEDSEWIDQGVLQTSCTVRDFVDLGGGVWIAATGENTANGAKIYKTTNYGFTWTLKATLGTEQRVSSLCYLGNGIVLAGTRNTGKIYKSIDYGETWVDKGQLGTETNARSFLNLGNGIILAGTNGGKIYKSINYGDTWSLLATLGSTKIRDMVNLGNGVILAGDGEAKIYKTINSGVNWALKTTFLTNLEVVEFKRVKDTLNKVLVSLSPKKTSGTATQRHIAVSDDLGDTWIIITDHSSAVTNTYVKKMANILYQGITPHFLNVPVNHFGAT